MSLEKTKIYVMGEQISHEELPESGAVSAEDFFAPVTLSAKAIDRASQLVPEEHWRPLGLHTWLSNRANEAFGKLPVSDREIRMGRLKYVFEYGSNGPLLKDLILLP
jgi:hypothetical protein